MLPLAGSQPPNNVYLVPHKPGDLSSLPYKTVRYVSVKSLVINKLSNAGLASRFYADPINPNRRDSECVRRTPDAFVATVQPVSIDHRRRHLFVTQQFLNRTDVIAILQQIGHDHEGVGMMKARPTSQVLRVPTLVGFF
jgi:hypothetical protein